MKPPVEAPTSSAIQSRRVDLERVERRGELVAAAADVGRRFRDGECRVRRDQVARLAVEAGAIALPHPDLARQHQRLRPTPRLDQAPLDEQLVEPNARRLDGLVGSSRRRGAHPPIVAQPASPRLTGSSAERPHARADRPSAPPRLDRVACHATILGYVDQHPVRAPPLSPIVDWSATIATQRHPMDRHDSPSDTIRRLSGDDRRTG